MSDREQSDHVGRKGSFKEGWFLPAHAAVQTPAGSFWSVFLRIPQELENFGSGERISDFLGVRMMLGDAKALLSFSLDPVGSSQPHSSSQMPHKGGGAAEVAAGGENHGLRTVKAGKDL